MSNFCIKRIQEDIMVIKKNRLDKDNIFVDVDEENLKKIRVMIIGPEKTPYENGYYFFEFNYTNNYPYEPPIVKFINPNINVRFHPNFYKKGKICLSILNTWHGPGWTASQNTSNILTTILSIMHKYPIQNEPGWENETGIKSQNYNNVIAYHNIADSIIKNIENIPFDFRIFQEICNKKFLKNKDKIKVFCNNYKKLEGEIVKSGIYMMTILDYDIYNLIDKIELLIAKLNKN